VHLERLIVAIAAGFGFSFAGAGPAATAPEPAPACSVHTATHQAMGAEFAIRVCAGDAETAAVLHEAAFEEIDRVDALLSNYAAASELSRVNREAAVGWSAVSPETLHFLRRAFEVSRSSDGAFDMTVGPLMRAWRFFRGSGRIPDPRELDQARARVGYRLVDLDEARGVRFARDGVELDPGAIGKGYAIDRAAAVLRAKGVRSALLDAGSSSIVAIGAPPGARGWTVRVPDPDAPSRTLSVVLLRDASLSTSGRREKCFVLGGVTYSHIMDPRTGRPVQGTLQATVIAPDGLQSDALSTTVFVLGPQQAVRFLSGLQQTSALLVTDGRSGERVVRWQWPGVGGELQ
jgi:FAD:protein FMN transferase